MPDVRLQRLTEWTAATLGHNDIRISVASADASFRRYFRASHGRRTSERTWIVMDAPPEKEDSRPYINVAGMLADAGVNAPKVIAQNLAEGFLLLSDLGHCTYLATLAQTGSTGRSADLLYRDALTTLVRMQTGCASRVGELPAYDAALLKREMELFPKWFIGNHLGLTIDAAERGLFASVFAILTDSALEQPRVFVHRDYHSRNLMATDSAIHGPNPGVLDFQDAVWGPITYDLVSLLRDCYIAWPIERVHAWLCDYRDRARQAGLDVGDDAQFLRWFDLMGVQRHLKAIGIFARLAHRDGKRGYLNDIPRTLNYIRAVLPAYPEMQSLAQFIDMRIVPLLTKLV